MDRGHDLQVDPLRIDRVMPHRCRIHIRASHETGTTTVGTLLFAQVPAPPAGRQLVLLKGGPRLGTPKTKASVRTIPLPQVVLDELARHVAAYPSGEEGFLFTNDKGMPIRRNWFSDQVWQPAAAEAGLPEWARFHDLRHFYASALIRHGESVKVVQARLGHASAAERLDTYSHL